MNTAINNSVAEAQWDKGYIAPGTDLDTLTATGGYKVNRYAVATSLVNAPTNVAGAMNPATVNVNVNGSGGVVQQWLTLPVAGRDAPIVVRNRDETEAWSQWRRQDDIAAPTRNEIDAKTTSLQDEIDGVKGVNGSLSSRVDATNARLKISTVEPTTYETMEGPALWVRQPTETVGAGLLVAREGAWVPVFEFTSDGEIVQGEVSPASGQNLVIDPTSDAYGALGNGAADDTTALTNAISAAVSTGKPLWLPPGRSFAISGELTFSGGLMVFTNGARFVETPTSFDGSMVKIESDVTVVGGLHITTSLAPKRIGAYIAGARVTVDKISVSASSAGGGAENNFYCGLKIAGSKVKIGEVAIKNFDRAVHVDAASQISIGRCDIENYRTGLWLRGSDRVVIKSGSAVGASPNAGFAPGSNFILMDSTAARALEFIAVSDFLGENAGEHGVRLGGQYPIRNVTLRNVTSRDAGGCGFKVLGGTVESGSRHSEIAFEGCTSIDAGNINQNSCGFLIQLTEGVRISSPVVKARAKNVSSTYGLRISGSDGVVVSGAKISRAALSGVFVDSSEYGAVSNLVFDGEVKDSGTSHFLLSNGAADFTDFRITAYCSGASQSAWSMAAPVKGVSRLSLSVAGSQPVVQSSGTMVGFLVDVLATVPPGSVSALPSSRWVTTTGSQYRYSDGQWVAV
ncbi:MAG: hypothetical protein EOM43_07455 [Gammaproteobacteria bacterium]|nr:hypothetical protein [Gammaproteobacteria bacterium]